MFPFPVKQVSHGPLNTEGRHKGLRSKVLFHLTCLNTPSLGRCTADINLESREFKKLNKLKKINLILTCFNF